VILEVSGSGKMLEFAALKRFGAPDEIAMARGV
jgi:hypothetical protein